MRRAKNLLPVLIAGFLALAARPALAEGNCPPGMYPIDGIGFQSCAPIPGYEDDYAYDDYSDDGWSEESGDPLSSLFDYVGGLFAADGGKTPQAQVAAAPERPKLPEGVTSIHESHQGIWLAFAIDGACSVVFRRGEQTLIFAGPSKKRPGAITFIGPDIPVPDAAQKTEIRLYANGKPVDVPALHMSNAGQGAIIVPTVITDTIKSIGDSEVVGVELGGREVFELTTVGAFAARDALLDCLG